MKGRNIGITLVPCIVGTVVSATLAIGYSMDNVWWISLVTAIIGVIGTTIGVFIQLRRDGKSIDKIEDRTIAVPFINDNTKRTKDVLIEEIKPQLNSVADRNEKIDFIAKEIEYQKRVKESVSSSVENQSILIAGIQSVFEENAKLQVQLKEKQQEITILRAKNNSLTEELNKYKPKTKDSEYTL